jgi:hypothetical protein
VLYDTPCPAAATASIPNSIASNQSADEWLKKKTKIISAIQAIGLSTLASSHLSRDSPFLSQAAEQAEALCYPAHLHDLILFTLELPLIECIQDDKGMIPGPETKIPFTLAQSGCVYSSALRITWSKALAAAGATPRRPRAHAHVSMPHHSENRHLNFALLSA